MHVRVCASSLVRCQVFPTSVVLAFGNFDPEFDRWSSAAKLVSCREPMVYMVYVFKSYNYSCLFLCDGRSFLCYGFLCFVIVLCEETPPITTAVGARGDAASTEFAYRRCPCMTCHSLTCTTCHSRTSDHLSTRFQLLRSFVVSVFYNILWRVFAQAFGCLAFAGTVHDRCRLWWPISPSEIVEIVKLPFFRFRIA